MELIDSIFKKDCEQNWRILYTHNCTLYNKCSLGIFFNGKKDIINKLKITNQYPFNFKRHLKKQTFFSRMNLHRALNHLVGEAHGSSVLKTAQISAHHIQQCTMGERNFSLWQTEGKLSERHSKLQ